MKQAKLNALTPAQQQAFKTEYDRLITDADFLTKPNRDLWKAVLDMFVNLVQVAKATLDSDIEALYPIGIFLLKKGDLEKYLGLASKRLPGVISFCNEKLFEFMGANSPEAEEIKLILQKVSS